MLEQEIKRSAPSKTNWILIVDDDLGVRVVLRQILEQEGFSVLEATNGREALELYQCYSPDLVLLDAMMPIMDGFDCCRSLCEKHQPFPVPVLMVTVLDDDDSIDRAFAAGASDYITKPINHAVLCQRVRRLVQQAHLIQQVKQMNAELETYAQTLNVTIRERTTQLQRALELESALKRITDRVRDSLDEGTIVQTAVQELVWALELRSCNASIYNTEERVADIRYEYAASEPGYHHRIIQMDNHPEIYQQLLKGKPIQFCPLADQAWRGQVALFAFPIKNGEIMGDLWLISDADRLLDDLEVRLVQQVTNQCSIAIRQARLYQASQVQVQELECLNQLKDDFLSTVSHELRTPVANMRMAIQLLERFTQRNQELSRTIPELAENLKRGNTYLQILHNECDREISLINDLLDLQRMEAGQQPLNLVTINLQEWLTQEASSLSLQTQVRQQTFQASFGACPPITTDPLYLRRILSELMSNACKYSPPGGEIILTAHVVNSPSALQIQLINTGVTIAESELERIFEKFYRVPGGDQWKQGGTGLGLALVQCLVNLLGGAISVSSAENQTCFLVEFPL